jgi:hypothetical protein
MGGSRHGQGKKRNKPQLTKPGMAATPIINKTLSFFRIEGAPNPPPQPDE